MLLKGFTEIAVIEDLERSPFGRAHIYGTLLGQPHPTLWGRSVAALA